MLAVQRRQTVRELDESKDSSSDENFEKVEFLANEKERKLARGVFSRKEFDCDRIDQEATVVDRSTNSQHQILDRDTQP